MSKRHLVKCDYCHVTADLTYNGEHYLPPAGWVQFYDDHRAVMLDTHACPKCKPKEKKAKKK